jgi:hypothetical protein
MKTDEGIAIGIMRRNPDGSTEGVDPQDIDLQTLRTLGHGGKTPLQVIRSKCLNSCVDQPSEVRKCTTVSCPLWPYKMGSNPFHGLRGVLPKTGGNPGDFSENEEDAA